MPMYGTRMVKHSCTRFFKVIPLSFFIISGSLSLVVDLHNISSFDYNGFNGYYKFNS
jgi:hypothetical protein